MDFETYYQKEILPELNEFELFRKTILAQYRKNKILLIASIIIYITILAIFYRNLFNDSYLSFIHPYYTPENNYTYLLPISIFFLIISSFLLYKINQAHNNFNYITKAELYNKIIGFYPNLEYQPFTEIESSIVKNSLLFADFDLFQSEDYIKGNYKGIEIQLAEIKLTKLIQNRQIIDNQEIITNREEPVFRGLFLISSLNKRFSSLTYVLPNRWFKIFTNLPAFLKRVTLEDPVFEENFDVYSNDQIESRYLLTPSFMERLLALNHLRSLRCCFVDNQLMIALAQENDFLPELNLSDSVDYQKVKQVIDEIQILFDVIDNLKLEMNIGL